MQKYLQKNEWFRLPSGLIVQPETLEKNNLVRCKDLEGMYQKHGFHCKLQWFEENAVIVRPFGSYWDGAQDLGSKICNEGGIDYFFRYYAGSNSFKTSPLLPYIMNYIEAADELERKLLKMSVDVNE